MWVFWIVAGLFGWLLIASVAALVIGRAIRAADQRELSAADLARFEVAENPNFVVASGPIRTVVTARPKRRRVPLPPVGVGLATLAVALEFAGFVLRLSGAHGETARLLSMDAPLSVPRMYITALFAAAAVAAFSGASRASRRRTWWTAVGLVATGICFVKAGGTIHHIAVRWLDRSIGTAGALVVSVGFAAAVVGVLWYLARSERRDRLRVLGGLTFYAVAAVGLSAVSAGASGFRAATTATFVEESGEALGATVFLVAVLVGVAPRLVLPADWALRRIADAHTVDAPNAAAARRPVAGA